MANATPSDAAVYSPIADLGSLNDVIKFSQNTAYALPKRKDAFIETGDVPLAFLFHIFKSLLTAVCYMSYGYRTIEEILTTDRLGPG